MDISLDFAIIVAVYTAIAAIIDYRQHRIPNYLTVPAAILGLTYHTLMPNGMGILASLAGLGIGFALLLLPWMLGGGGMGDVKLLAALGAWLGPLMVLTAFAASMVTAALLAMAIMAWSTMTKGMERTKKRFLNQGKNRKPKRVLPFAVPVALSTWVMMAWFVLKQSLLS